MPHFNLKATIGDSEVVAESLELNGSKPFKVFPVSRNEGQVPIRGSVVVNILGKNHSIQLNHRVKSYEDPETSSTKWSYIENLYINGTTPVDTPDIKSQDIGYIRASRGKTIYDSDTIVTQNLIISRAYTTYQGLIDSVGDFSDSSVGTTYNKGSLMTLFTFVMFYKYSTEVDGEIVPPTDDDTPASNKARIPCRPDVSGAPDWIRDARLIYQVMWSTDGIIYAFTEFNTWEVFIDFWERVQADPTYVDASFHYLYKGTVDFNELSTNRDSSDSVTVSEIDNGKGIGIHGAKPLYLKISQQNGKTSYSISMIPSETYMWDNIGRIMFEEPSAYNISQNRCTPSPDSDNNTYNIKPKFRIKSDQASWAANIPLLTGGTIISNPDSANIVNYQYIGQPFIIKLFKETANGIEGINMRPYYKTIAGITTTEFWRDSSNIMGSQHFNPLRYSSFDGSFHYVTLRNEIGFRSFISGPMTGNHGMCILQLIPLCLYLIDGTMRRYNPVERLVNWNTRYNNYNSAILDGDRFNAAFLKWPNADGNNDPDHIENGNNDESLPSYVGKNWEHTQQYAPGFKVINRVMFAPVLWTEKQLESNQDLRDYLAGPRFGYYLLSPNITDAEIDINQHSVYRVQVEGLDIQII